MSKQAEAKKKQWYVPKIVIHTCSDCGYMKCDMELPLWRQSENAAAAVMGRPAKYGDNCKTAKNMRCAIGGFAVKKMGVCQEWVSKD